MRGQVRQPFLKAKERQERRANKERLIRLKLDREQAVRAALAKPTRLDVQAVISRVVGEKEKPSAGLEPLFGVVSKKSPKLLRDEDALGALCNLGSLDPEKWVRPVGSWCPHGKGVMTVFRSLAAHLLALFPMPAFVWQIFFRKDDYLEGSVLVDFVVHVASGGSPFAAVKDGSFPVPLTRKMCHLLMLSKSESLVEAIRSAQVKALGGDESLVYAWCREFSDIQSRAVETFWQVNLPWFCRNPMLDKNQIKPLVDYIIHRRNQDAGFSLAGRSVLAMVRGMEEWHRELGRGRSRHSGSMFARSGFGEADFDQSIERNGEKHKLIWHIREILTGSRLAEEGRNMSHCVYSYADSIANGKTSIWSLTKEDDLGSWHALTLEVRNSDRAVTQARGRFNRDPDHAERAIMGRWANENGLSVRCW